MKGGFRYKITSKNSCKNNSKKSCKNSKKSNIKRSVAGKLKKLKKMHKFKVTKNIKILTKIKKSKKYRRSRKSRRHRKSRRCYKQGGGTSLNFSYLDDVNNNTISDRLSAGVHFNTNQGFGIDLSNPPLSGIKPNSQCLTN